MDTKHVYADAYGRIKELVRSVAEGLDEPALAFRPDADANSIGWLLWHMTRVQDDHVSEIAGRPQAWIADGWAARFGLDPDPADIGYGHTKEQVAKVRPSGDVLVGYHDVVAARTAEYLDTIDVDELDRIIDTSWDPPVSVGVRLVSVIGDSYQHVGQAAYLKGMVDRM